MPPVRGATRLGATPERRAPMPHSLIHFHTLEDLFEDSEADPAPAPVRPSVRGPAEAPKVPAQRWPKDPLARHIGHPG